MDQPIVAGLVAEIAWMHSTMLETTGSVAERDFGRTIGPKAPSIGFHVWHTARWADRFSATFPVFASRLARVPEGSEEIWISERLADRWGMRGALGTSETGEGLDDDESSTLVLPGSDEVRAYAETAFQAAERVFASVRDDDLLEPTGNFYDEPDWTVLEHFGWHVSHGNRHLGMIEALRGVFGADGSATV